MNLLRNRHREQPTDIWDQENAYTEQGYERNDDLYEKINLLPSEIQTVIKLRFYEELSLKEIAAAAAAVLAVFVTALNTSTVFAQEMEKIPVIGAIARVFTFSSYVEENEDMTIAVNIPSLEMISQDTEGLADSVNETIHTFCEQYAQEAVKRAEEYKEAFMATGGTQEEWEAHNIQIDVGYELKSQTPEYLSFIVTGTENWTSAYAQTLYYTIDLGSTKLVSLQDVLGPDYRSIADESIRAQMKARTDVEFFSPEEGGFTGIDENTKFYMNADGNPVIVFEKYEIAPGSAGQPEFVIGR